MSRAGHTAAWASLVAAGVAVVVAALAGVATLGLATVGVALLAAGVWRRVGAAVTFGALGLLFAVLLAGTVLAPLPTLLGGLGAMVAWDAGQHASELDRQLAPESPTRAVELRHLGHSLVVGAVGVGVAYGGYLFAVGGFEAGSAALLFVGCVALLVAFGREF
ncbi:DUF7519 family protein [Haloarchaeobius litoreus]|uniref:Uncharacterized protein n=1 Tax=Haloarchaeobius litoreus TaxID=755306 RepID=A0ABD6DLI1_9EURY|nr:hypothetical protein [Haloarchaeobius litoreus]